jgi:hypothetical protein
MFEERLCHSSVWYNLPSMLTLPEGFVSTNCQNKAALSRAIYRPVDLYRHRVHAPSLGEVVLDNPMNKASASAPAVTRCLLARCLMANGHSQRAVFLRRRLELALLDEAEWNNLFRTCSDAGRHAMTLHRTSRLEADYKVGN